MDPKIVEATSVAAVKHGIPPAVLGALFNAESGLDPAAERWGNLTKEAKAALAARDWAALTRIIDSIVIGAGSDDISFGLDQRTWRWSEEFQEAQRTTGRSVDELRRDMHMILAFRDASLRPEYAAERGAKMLGPLYATYGVPEALYRYNKPNGTATKAVKARYDKSLEWAKAQDWSIQMPEEFAFETEGFASKAEELGEAIVGQPIEAEHDLGKDYTVQFTTTGAMVYVKSLNTNYFFEAAR